jgi:peptidoglycan/LPS O-acetylase OafA/YrhL
LLWPLILLLVLRSNRRAAAWVTAGLIVGVTVWAIVLVRLLGASGFRLDDGPDVRSVGLLVGCFVALNLRKLLGLARPGLVLAAVIVIAVVSELRFFATSELDGTGALTLFCLACGVLVVAATLPLRCLRID